MFRASLAVLALACALTGAAPAQGQDTADGDGDAGLYEPFPEPSASGGLSLYGAETQRSAARRAFASRLRETPRDGGAANARAAGAGDLLALPPLLGPLLFVVGVLAVHGWGRRGTHRA